MSTLRWRECPFVPGRSYRVRLDFSALRDRFKEGEILVYQSDAWSRYDGITGYFFQQPGFAGVRVWDVYDDGDLGTWKEFFEELPEE